MQVDILTVCLQAMRLLKLTMFDDKMHLTVVSDSNGSDIIIARNKTRHLPHRSPLEKLQNFIKTKPQQHNLFNYLSYSNRLPFGLIFG